MPHLPIKTVAGWGALVSLLLISVGISGMMGGESKKLTGSLAKARRDNEALAKTHGELTARVSTLEAERDAAQQDKQAIVMDRDNVLAQLRRYMEERGEVERQRDLFAAVLKRAGRETRSLKSRLGPLEQEHATLQDAYAAVLQERSALKAELADALKQANTEAITAELLKEQQARKQDADALRKAELRVQALESDQAQSKKELAEATRRYAALQDQYTTIMSENTTLKRQSKRVPAEVARMAKQHEKLVKETADMHYNLGVLLTRSRQYYQAASEFRKVIEMRPDDADAHYNLGVIYAEHLPDQRKAIDYFRKYMVLNPRGSESNWVKQYIASWQAWEGKERLE